MRSRPVSVYGEKSFFARGKPRGSEKHFRNLSKNLKRKRRIDKTRVRKYNISIILHRYVLFRAYAQ